jgi:hypothetical protein
MSFITYLWCCRVVFIKEKSHHNLWLFSNQWLFLRYGAHCDYVMYRELVNDKCVLVCKELIGAFYRNEKCFVTLLPKLRECICKIMQGGTSSGYKKFVEEKGLKDETYCSDGTALIQISGTAVHNNKTLQVDAVFLTSTCCKYIDFHSHKHSENF